jgi:hypothetical protein
MTWSPESWNRVFADPLVIALVRLSQDGALLGKLTRIFVETVSAFYAKRAADDGAKTGAVTVVQRTSSDLT